MSTKGYNDYESNAFLAIEPPLPYSLTKCCAEKFLRASTVASGTTLTAVRFTPVGGYLGEVETVCGPSISNAPHVLEVLPNTTRKKRPVRADGLAEKGAAAHRTQQQRKHTRR